VITFHHALIACRKDTARHIATPQFKPTPLFNRLEPTMSRVFAYARVSTVEQLTENQREQIAAAGYRIEPRRFIEEKVSGSVPARQRPGFAKLLDRMEAGDTLVVSKLDRIGRDSIDVQKTVELCVEQGIRLIVLQLGNLDLASSSGALMVKVLAAVADFERELIIERTRAGQARSRAAGTHMGRPRKTSDDQREKIRLCLAEGRTVSAVAREFNLSRATVIGIRAGAAADQMAPMRTSGLGQRPSMASSGHVGG
jgi:putative DNA-invertase from lambdoid prophage Rac